MSILTLNADLHSHSTISDGVLTPAALAERAKANGVDVWALTDHDEVSGVAAAVQRHTSLIWALFRALKFPSPGLVRPSISLA
jgi:histidinol phosphatase-like PHP family hydrolase